MHHVQVIRADLDLARRPSPTTPARPSRRRFARRARAKPEPGESPGTADLSAAGRRSRPGRGRAEGQGRAIRCSSPAPASRCSTPSCAATRPPPGRCAPAWRFRAPRPPPRSCASTPTKARCATCASPSATSSALRRILLRLWRELAGRPPSLDPGRLAAAAARARPGRGPERPRSQPEGLRRGGRSGLRGREGRRLRVLRLPGRPSGRSRNPRPLGVRHGPRHPAALAAARAADRDENSGSRPCGRPAAVRRPRPGDPAWPNAAAGAIALAAASALDLAADLSRRSEHPASPSRPNCGRNRRQKSSTCCSPKIASRPPKRPARRR